MTQPFPTRQVKVGSIYSKIIKPGNVVRSEQGHLLRDILNFRRCEFCPQVIPPIGSSGTADDEMWPMIQTKLEVLSKVGLGNENFTDKDTENVQHKARFA